MSRVPEDGRYMERQVLATTPGVQEDAEGRLAYTTETGDAQAPRWALCSDCRFEGLRTCPEMPTCWHPTATADLPEHEPHG